MNRQKILFIFLLIFVFGTNSYATDYDNLQLAAAGKLLIERRGTYIVPSDWVYEGVVMDDEGKFPQKKYTLVKDLDESILYGNRNIFDEMKARVPFISKDSFRSTFSNQDLAQIIASASGGETSEVDYGENHYYETITTQQAVQNGKTVNINCIIDMFFEDEYIHSFSYSYKTRTDGLNDYKALLASFKLNADIQQQQSKQEENNQVVEEKPVEVIQQNPDEVVEQNQVENAEEVVITPEPTIIVTEITPEPTIISTESTPEPIKEIENVEEKTSGDVKEEIKKENTLEESGELVEPIIETINSGEIISSGEEINEEIGNIENQEENKKEDNENVEVIENTDTTVTEVRKPIQKKSTLAVILGIPAVRRLIVFCVIFDITITLIIKNRKKRKAQKNTDKNEEINSNNNEKKQ